MSTELLTTAVDCFWLFFGGVLVFFMQTGFTMVEAGFTRSKNTGNIIMKNIVDFMFGSIIYWFIGYGLMYGEGNGFIGIPFGDMFMNGMAGAENMDYTALFFQTVFCATSATIVSGAMAERTNFKAYCIYSAAISLFMHWLRYNLRIDELESMTLQSELKFLKNQINPHFHFNMLNNANVLIKRNPEEASKVLFKLEDLLRYQINDSSRERVSLASDIRFLNDYLNL